MATTYGYGGEFSSDEDIDKMEQQSERLVHQSKFDSYLSPKPTRHQVEEAIESIKLMPLDQDVNITDELLAGLLDYYKTQRGPIVDSTRNLYKKIILRLVRGDQQQQQQASNGNNESSNGNNNNITSNNNNNNLLDKRQQSVEAASSDEDEPMPPATSLLSGESKGRKFDSRVVYENRLEPMEVDSEVTAGGHTIRASKQVDISTTDEEDSDTDDEATSDSDSEVLDLTPVKTVDQTQATQEQQQVAPPKSSSQTSASSKQPSEVVKRSMAAGSSPALAKGKTDDSSEAKKQYTTRRSQRVAATRATTSARKITQTDVSSSKVDAVEASTEGVFQTTQTRRGLSSRSFQVKFLLSALFIASLAYLIYYFGSDLTKTTDRILSRAIKF